MEHSRFEVRFAGSGGQGIILAGLIFAEAATLEGYYVTNTQSYGPEARGGASRSDVVISDTPIDYPKTISPDILICLNQSSCDLYFKDLREDGILIVDPELIDQVPTERSIKIPFRKISSKIIGNGISANMVALGALIQITKKIPQRVVEKAIEKRAPKGTVERNIRAFRAGLREAKKVDLQSLPKRILEGEEEI